MMHWPLAIIVLQSCSISGPAPGSSTAASTSTTNIDVGRRYAALDNMAFTDYLLFSRLARSLPECAGACAVLPACVAFTFCRPANGSFTTSAPGTNGTLPCGCRGHDAQEPGGGRLVPGTRFYLLQGSRASTTATVATTGSSPPPTPPTPAAATTTATTTAAISPISSTVKAAILTSTAAATAISRATTSTATTTAISVATTSTATTTKAVISTCNNNGVKCTP